MCHEQGGLKQSLQCQTHTLNGGTPIRRQCLRRLCVLLMEKPPALVSNSAFICQQLPWQRGANHGCPAGWQRRA